MFLAKSHSSRKWNDNKYSKSSDWTLLMCNPSSIKCSRHAWLLTLRSNTYHLSRFRQLLTKTMVRTAPVPFIYIYPVWIIWCRSPALQISLFVEYLLTFWTPLSLGPYYDEYRPDDSKLHYKFCRHSLTILKHAHRPIVINVEQFSLYK